MLYEFKSKATGNVVMTGPIAERLLAIVGREPAAKGIFTVEQMPEAIAALQAAVERERAESSQTEAEADERTREAMRSVSLAQRAWPLIDMLRTAHAAKQPVTWGV
jgi:Fe-S cluster assembly ATPase SufC